MKGLLFFVAAIFMALAAPLPYYRSHAQVSPDESKIGPVALRQINALIREKESRTPAQQKIDSQLLVESKLRRGDPIAQEVPSLRMGIETDEQGKIDLVLTAKVDDKLLAELARMGITVTSSLPEYNAIAVRMSLEQMEPVAALEQVRFIRQKDSYRLGQKKLNQFSRSEFGSTAKADRERFNRVASDIREAVRDIPAERPDAPVQIGIGSSEGDITHRALSARGTFNIDGTGVKIGVLSDGVDHLAAAQATGDLGPVTVLPNQQGGGDEGTAMLEIVHDIAPGAQLYFASGVNNMAGGFAQNIRALRAAGCDIIVDDISYYAESPFQNGQAAGIVSNWNGGVITQAVNDVVADGALYFSSAGNNGNKNDGNSGTWEGDFVNSGPIYPALENGPTGYVVHDFDPTSNVVQFNQITASGFPSPIVLHWNDPIGASSNDYDLYILYRDYQVLATLSNNVQNGTQDPVESLTTSLGNQAGSRIVVVRKTEAQDRFFHLSNYDGLMAFSTDGDTYGHNAASGAFGVAAVPTVPTFPAAFSSQNKVEFFSSDGPRRFFLKPDGSPITPGNLSSTGGTLIQQPVFAAADGVSISGAGGFSNPFLGTSAAAPHAAAIAALIKSARPSLTREQVKDVMASSAVDIEAPGVDRDSGYGIAMPYNALRSLGGSVVGKAYLEIGEITQTETCCNSDGYILPGEQGELKIELKNTGILAASGITTTLTTTTPGVTIQNGSSAYENTAPESGWAVNTTPFAVSLGPELPHDPRVRFTLTINYIGGHAPTQTWDFTVDFGFQPRPFDPGANSTVTAIAVQPDGKVLVGGDFNGPFGLGLQSHSGIGRLNPDGSVDSSFDPGCSGRVYAIAVQPDGKIVVGGFFRRLGGGGLGNTQRLRIGRLHPDGSLDATFNPGISPEAQNDEVWALLIQPDGKILVGGNFTTAAGQPRNNIARLNPDGSLDTSFNPTTNWASSFALQPDGKIIVVGSSTFIGEGGITVHRNNLTRLNPDGSVDPSFEFIGGGVPILGVVSHPDDKLLIYGNIMAQGGPTGTTAGIARLNSDGSVDHTYTGEPYLPAFTHSLQADGKSIVGGDFSYGGGAPIPNFIGGVDANGRLNNFTPGANGRVFATALDSKGMLLVGGEFSTLGRGGFGQDYRRRIGRVSNTSLASDALSVDESGTQVTWMRGGTSPEVYRVTFESSADGANYTQLGNGSRIPGGWRFSGVPLSEQQRYIRARGFYTTGRQNGSGSIVERVIVRNSATTSVSGRVLTPAGVGIRNVTVFLTDSQGIRRTATTSSFGYYAFATVVVGEPVTITVASKRYRFAPRQLFVSGELTNIDLLGLE